MYKKKYLLVFGTRPEAIKMAPVAHALAGDPQADCIVCITGQHEDLLNPVLSLFRIQPHYRLHVMSHNQQLCGLTSILLKELEQVIIEERPDWVVVQGDTTSAMAASMAAFYLKVRVAHVEAGIRSHNQVEPFPEEINRRIIDVIAGLHFAPTILDKYDLIREGFPSASIHVTGNTSIDALSYVLALPFSVEASVLKDLPLASKRIILATVHRRENHGQPLENICKAIQVIANQYRHSVHLIIPVHPNPNVAEPIQHHLTGIENITLMPPLGYQELIALAKASFFVMTDSGGLQEELPWLGKPTLVLRNVTDRREAVLVGSARLVGVKAGPIVSAAIELMENAILYNEMAQSRNLFGDGMASARIAKILQSYDSAVINFHPEVPMEGSLLHVARSQVATQTDDLLLDTDSTFEELDNRML
jgi:UDP-N-acetylglucosamine 2-epimerase (non-hydrolysing)